MTTIPFKSRKEYSIHFGQVVSNAPTNYDIQPTIEILQAFRKRLGKRLKTATSTGNDHKDLTFIHEVVEITADDMYLSAMRNLMDVSDSIKMKDPYLLVNKRNRLNDKMASLDEENSERARLQDQVDEIQAKMDDLAQDATRRVREYYERLEKGYNALISCFRRLRVDYVNLRGYKSVNIYAKFGVANGDELITKYGNARERECLTQSKLPI